MENGLSRPEAVENVSHILSYASECRMSGVKLYLNSANELISVDSSALTGIGGFVEPAGYATCQTIGEATGKLSQIMSQYLQGISDSLLLEARYTMARIASAQQAIQALPPGSSASGALTGEVLTAEQFALINKQELYLKVVKGLGAASKVAPVLAVGIVAYSYLDMCCRAYDAYSSGDDAKGRSIITHWTTEMAGGLVGFSVGSSMVAPISAALCTLGPAGILGGASLYLLGGLLGCCMGVDFGRKLGDQLCELFEGIISSIDEITTLYMWDPLMIDLNGDGNFTVSQAAGAHFDFMGDQFAEKTGWVSPEDGLLVRDIDGNGRIDNGRELFGDQTLLPDGSIAEGGFQALAPLDENHDGLIDGKDAAYSELKIWMDQNGDGMTQDGELHSLESMGITSIGLRAESVAREENGNQVVKLGRVTMADGSHKDLGELHLDIDSMHTIHKGNVEVPDHIKSLLPNLHGLGTTRDLHQAMALDTELENLVTQYCQSTDFDEQRDLLTAIVTRWTGSNDVETGSRGPNIDATHLAALEAFYGRSFWGIGGRNPNTVAGAALERVYSDLLENISAQLLVQSQVAPYILLTVKNKDADTGEVSLDFSMVKDLFARNAPSGGLHIQNLLTKYIKCLQSDSEYAPYFSLDDMKDVFNDLPGFALGFKMAEANTTSFLDHSGTSSGGLQNDLMFGSSGNDRLSGGAGDDILIGGKGDDVLSGGAGNDVYVIGLGDGADVISDSEGLSTVRFLDGIAPDDIRAVKEDSSLVLWIKGQDQRLTLSNFFYAYGSQFRNFNFEFADGTRLGCLGEGGLLQRIELSDQGDSLSMAGGSLTLVGGAGNDYMSVSSGENTLLGGAGDDSLNGGIGADVLDGGAGNDRLSGGAGDDVLIGGKGDDALSGGKGDDVYVIGLGDGADIISDSEGLSTVRFLDGIAPDDIRAVKEGSSLVLWIKGQDQRLTLSNFFYAYGSQFRNFNFEFADGTRLGCLGEGGLFQRIQKVDEIRLSELSPLTDGLPLDNANDRAVDVLETVSVAARVSPEHLAGLLRTSANDQADLLGSSLECMPRPCLAPGGQEAGGVGQMVQSMALLDGLKGLPLSEVLHTPDESNSIVNFWIPHMA